MSVQSGRQRLLLSMLNEQLTCRLCSGYFIDATTIIKCLHSFCRSCIVKYLEKSKYCPICEVQVHESKPLLNIRPDCTLQDIVYKLVPGCYQNEMRCRREFYANHPDANISNLSPESKGELTDSHIYSADEHLSLSLEYHNSNVKAESDDEESETKVLSIPRRYFRCPAAVTVFHLQKLIRAKHGLSDAHRIDILYKEDPLSATYTLMDIMYIYHWRRKVPLHLSYRIFESSPKRIKLSEDNAEFKKSLSESGIGETEAHDEHAPKEWKEVQLKISETGVMSITDITNSDSKKNVRSLDAETKSDANALVSTKTPKDSTAQDVKSTNEGKELRIKEEVEKTVTRSATKLSASKAEEKSKNEEKTISTKMDTRASSKEAGKSDTPKCTRSSSQILLNNNSISSERELEEQKQDSKSSSGSKINALSAKLQFQPKVGQVNNTYSKKGSLKERKAAQNVKSSDSKPSKTGLKSDTKPESPSKAPVSKTETEKTEPKVKVSTSVPETSKSVSATTSVTVKTSSAVVSSTKTTPSTVRTTVAKSGPVSTSTTTTSSQSSQSQSGTASSQTKLSTSQTVTTQSTSKLQSSNEKSGIKPSMTIIPVSSLENVSSGISYPTKDTKPSPQQKLSVALSNCKSLLTSSPSSLTSTSFSPESPVMSIYPTSLKNSYSINSSSNVLTITTVVNSTASSNTVKVKSVTSSPITSTTISTPKPEPKSDSIPPCPDAIPLSMMKTTMRKNQLLSKGTNSSDNSNKTPGSKIDDICAKIGENSKEKNKLENRTKADIPGLLEIPKKMSPTSEQIIKQIPSIQVPIFKPSSKELCPDSYKILPSLGHSLQASPTTSQKVSSSKKRVSSFSYKTLRTPPRSWNPTLSKNNYVAIKNQTKEMQQQFCDSKQIASKPSKIFTMRNPRYLGNPASGVKPMYNVGDSDKDKDQSTSTSGSSKSHTVSMTKLDPQTLQPIMSMVPSPPYSKDRTYQNVPFSNRDIRSSSSPVSPRNSPVNMLSTSPFIPSPTPNTNPRLIYSNFPPTFPNASRFPHSIMPHSPINLPPPISAFHSSLPQVKFYQRSSYGPHAGGFNALSQLPTVQRIPPTSLSSAPKSPKSSVESKSSSSGLTDNKQDEGKNSKRKIDMKMFNLFKSEDAVKQLTKMELLGKISALGGSADKKASPPKKEEKKEEETKCKRKEVKEESKDGKEIKQTGEEVKELSRVNGEVTEQSNNAEVKKEERKSDKEEEKVTKKDKDTTNGASQNVGDKLEDDAWRKSADQVQAKKVEIQRTKAES